MHSHAHSHGHATGKVLVWSLAATVTFVAVEVIAGIRAHSLALLSDAGHNLTDALAECIRSINKFPYEGDSKSASV